MAASLVLREELATVDFTPSPISASNRSRRGSGQPSRPNRAPLRLNRRRSELAADGRHGHDRDLPETQFSEGWAWEGARRRGRLCRRQRRRVGPKSR
ncbi:hypothetical protein BRADI_5g14035v3 [Brachypodium distachyon]|uniref:Uncharacterized protein n=1 Tax=Brachypodium distachyon TaxID=15368 RepID=A0A2K2CH29_BRADI|nr:hypothetical protein BRADI_5g14035v3 [Brachypodium distachyon]